MSKKVATHNGVFHADDVFSIAFLQILDAELEVVRNRDPKVIAEADYVVDVGGEHDPQRGRFDHHQYKWQDGEGEFSPAGVPRAAFGLLWSYYPLAADVLGMLDVPAEHRREVHRLVDERIVQGVDASDLAYRPRLVLWQGDGQGSGASVAGWENGTGLEGLAFDGGYNATHTAHSLPPRPGAGMTVSQLISSLNPCWDEEGVTFDERFEEATHIADLVIRQEVGRALSEVKARAIVRQAIAAAADPRVIVLERFCPWQETVIEEAPEAQFVVFPSETGDWRVQTVPVAVGSFHPRRPLPKEWWGLRGPDLDRATGLENSVFCHPNGFIAGVKDCDDATSLAALALGKALV